MILSILYVKDHYKMLSLEDSIAEQQQLTNVLSKHEDTLLGVSKGIVEVLDKHLKGEEIRTFPKKPTLNLNPKINPHTPNPDTKPGIIL